MLYSKGCTKGSIKNSGLAAEIYELFSDYNLKD